MPTRNTPLVSGEYYHLFNRGVNKQPIFFNKVDYRRTLHIMDYYSYKDLPYSYSKFLVLSSEGKAEILPPATDENKIVKIVCMCLMPNHFHFLIQQLVDGGITKFMSNFQNSLTKYINIKHERIGPLLQGEFKSVHVLDDRQLLHLSRYIHLNPYTSYLVKNLVNLQAYPWSSYNEYIFDTQNEKYNKKIILSQFKNREDYKQFVNDYASYERELDAIKHLLLEESN